MTDYKEGSYTDYQLLPTHEGEPTGHREATPVLTYPGLRRPVITTNPGPPPNSVMVRTGGNALQAVSRSVVEQLDCLAVVVPVNHAPGDLLAVNVPYSFMDNKEGSTGTPMQNRTMLVTIPPGYFPGHTFFVQPTSLQTKSRPVITTPVAPNATAVVQGSDVTTGSSDLSLVEEGVEVPHATMVTTYAESQDTNLTKANV
jgi:hypothetical protein